jgi:AcrR family transcriptional regulator
MPTVPPKQMRGGRHGLPRTEVVASQRRRLMDSIVAAVAERGFAATTVADVISRAGVSRSTFYEQFSDKDDCFVAAHDDLIERLIGFVSAAYVRGESLEDKVRLGLDAFLQALAARPEGARFAFIEVMAASPRAHDQHRDALRRFVAIFDEVSELAEHSDELPASLSRVVVGGVAALVYEEIAAGRQTSVRRLLPEALYLALVPYLGHERALEEMKRVSSRDGAGATEETA